MSIYKLTRIHRRIQDEIRRESARLRPSPWRLLRLKKLRLLIKERLTVRALRAQAA
jgi:uncharacterized protein